MKRIKFFLISFLVLLPGLVWAECGTIGFFNRFAIEGMNTVTLYLGPQAVARFDLQTCSIRPDSTIQLIKNYVCDGDEVIVDGANCTVIEVKPLGP